MKVLGHTQIETSFSYSDVVVIPHRESTPKVQIEELHFLATQNKALNKLSFKIQKDMHDLRDAHQQLQRTIDNVRQDCMVTIKSLDGTMVNVPPYKSYVFSRRMSHFENVDTQVKRVVDDLLHYEVKTIPLSKLLQLGVPKHVAKLVILELATK